TGDITFAGANANVTNAGAFSLGGAARTVTFNGAGFTLNTVTLDGDLTLAGAGLVSVGTLTESGGAHSLTKSSTGTLTLSTANSYSGGTVVNAGTLNVNAASALGTGGLALNG